MHSAKSTMTKTLSVFFLVIITQQAAFSQENSPYSRYGFGDIVPAQNLLTRGMGGISAGYSDFQSVNFVNPASYGNLVKTIFDVGVEVDTRTLKSVTPLDKYTASNLIISYLQLGIPIKMKKANKKGIFWGMNIGLRPVSKINYKIQKNERLSGIDSLQTIYQGSGGVNEAYLGTGVRIKNFSIGFNAGYMFGNKNYSTNLSFQNDTVQYYQSSSSNKTNFGGLFFNSGVQYQIILQKGKKYNGTIRLGAYGSLKQQLKASEDVVRQTVGYDVNGNQIRTDSVFENSSNGKIVYPANYGFGFTYQDKNGHWLVGADYEATTWTDYRFFDENSQNGQLQNNWKIRFGGDYFPATEKTPIAKYFNFVHYRMGFYYGPDYIKVNNNLPEYGITLGAGFPLKLRKGYYETQSSILNTTIEMGKRGDSKSNLTENLFRISFGLSLGDLWFQRAKYY